MMNNPMTPPGVTPPAMIVSVAKSESPITHRHSWASAWLILLALAASPGVAGGQSVLNTGITGTVSSSGLENPQFVLSFPSVQELLLQAARGPVAEARVTTALRDTPVEIHHLLDLELLRPSSEGYRLNYLLLTIEDQTAIHNVAEGLGGALATAFLARQDEFDAIFARFAPAKLRHDVAFGLVAGFLLNWEGLALTTKLGYRVDAKEWPNGDRFLVHSSERGARLPSKGLYSGSHSFPGETVVFTTFGDGPSQPRVTGIPDVFFGPADAGLADLRDAPTVLAAVRGHYIAYMARAIEDAGLVMMALAAGPRTRDEIGARVGRPAALLDATIGILVGTGYVTERSGRYAASVVVLQPDHQTLVDETLNLGREILTDWLEANYETMERDLSGLSPMRNGLPFQLVFSEVWHDVFGFTSKILAERGFYADPYADDAFEGFVPIIWALLLYPLEL